MKQYISNVIIHDGIHEEFKGSVMIEDGKIRDVVRESEEKLPKQSEAVIFDGQGMHLLPGMIDVHLHGGYGYDFIDQPEKGIEVLGKNLIKEGTTGFLASLTVISHSDMLGLLKRYSRCKSKEGDSEFLGVHSEGPYLSEKYHALMDTRYLRDPDDQELLEMEQAALNSLKVMTIAPEREGTLDLIENHPELTFMVGHSAASCTQALSALKAGAKGFTHLYNAMSGHVHREPGCVTAAFLDDNAYAELIADGFHVHPDVLRVTWKALGPERIVLITDAMPGQGMPDGEYIFSNLECVKKGNTVRVKDTGRIAGSAITMMDAIRNMRKFCSCTFDDLAKMASRNPSRIAGVSETKGTIEPGKDADLILLDNNMQLHDVFKGGRHVYHC